jgi:hypothetical protein
MRAIAAGSRTQRSLSAKNRSALSHGQVPASFRLNFAIADAASDLHDIDGSVRKSRSCRILRRLR